MNFSMVRTGLICLAMLFTAGCAHLNSMTTAPTETPLEGKRVAVFPFPDPYYHTRQIAGIGAQFTTVFIAKLQAAGVTAESAAPAQPVGPQDVVGACRYAKDAGYDAFLTGTITEWIDGATQWSGKVDVASLTVNLYRADTCAFAGSASGSQNGQWFTFVDAPTTRFIEPLSEAVVGTLTKGTVVRQ
jgi:hypothetical protein